PKKVELLKSGPSYIRHRHIGSADIAKLLSSKKFSASTDFSRLREVEAVIIFVPTPLNKDREPDLSYVLRTGRAIAPYLAPDHRAPRPSSIPGPGGQRVLSPSWSCLNQRPFRGRQRRTCVDIWEVIHA